MLNVYKVTDNIHQVLPAPNHALVYRVMGWDATKVQTMRTWMRQQIKPGEHKSIATKIKPGERRSIKPEIKPGERKSIETEIKPGEHNCNSDM